MAEKDKDIEKIVIQYEDGSTKEINKGFLCSMTSGVDEDGDETVTMSFNMAKISGKELTTIVHGVIELGNKMGMFDDIEDED